MDWAKLNNKKPQEISFYGVALLVILIGATVLGMGIAGYFLNIFFGFSLISPSSKVMGGSIVTVLGYIFLEIELLRKSIK